MATKKNNTNYVRIKHRMNEREKRLFRLLFEYALPEFYTKKEHTINAQDLVKLWAPETLTETPADFATLLLERAFFHIGTTLTFNCTANQQRPSWGGMAIFSGRSIKENGLFTYSYSQEFKKILNTPLVLEQLLKEELIAKAPEPQEAFEAKCSVSGFTATI